MIRLAVPMPQLNHGTFPSSIWSARRRSTLDAWAALNGASARTETEPNTFGSANIPSRVTTRRRGRKRISEHANWRDGADPTRASSVIFQQDPYHPSVCLDNY